MQRIIGCTTRPYRDLPYAEAFAKIAAAGFTDVAVFNNQGRVPVRADSTAEEVAEVRKSAAEAGVTPSMVIGGTKLELGIAAAEEDFRRLIDNVAAVGATWLLNCGTSNEAHFEDYFELMRRCAPHAQAAGISITMKPHGGISITSDQLLAALGKVDHPAFQICYDPGNIIYYTKGTRRPEQDVEQVAAMTSTAIIKDCVVEDGKADVAVTPGDGLVDFPVVLGKLLDGGYDGPFYLECVGGTSEAEINRNVAFSLGYVQGILAALTA